jgi:hypothetical protein
MLALAYYVERQIEAGTVRDFADAAKRLGLTRARMTQVMNLLQLAPVMQEDVLLHHGPIVERRLREMAQEPNWSQQARSRDQ